MELNASAVVITGASSGIGEALAHRYARAGWKVGLIARRHERLAEIAANIRAGGATAAIAAADVAKRESIREAVSSLRIELGPIDLIISCAGVGLPTSLNPMNIAEIEETFAVNTMGVIYAIEAVLPEMLERGRGQLAAVSSLAGFHGLPGESAYCASKAAVNSYLQGLRIQLRGTGVTVTCICPGFVKTPMTDKDPYPQPFQISAEKCADAIYRGIRRRKKLMRFPWQTSLMMRVLGLLPDWAVKRAVGAH